MRPSNIGNVYFGAKMFSAISLTDMMSIPAWRKALTDWGAFCLVLMGGWIWRVIPVNIKSLVFILALSLGGLAGVVSSSWAENPETYVNSLGMEFVLIPAGSFIMGASPNDSEAGDDEKPAHKVTISQPFYLGKYEVTQEQWSALMERDMHPRRYKVLTNPVEFVSWDDVQKFIKRLNQREGVSEYRLPTEAEWEYAARAGTNNVYSFGDDPKGSGLFYGWYGDSFWAKKTRPVGRKLSNPWGLYDMHGNVWEWVQDLFSSDYYSSSPETDPKGPSEGCARVIRGGSYLGPSRESRSGSRSHKGSRQKSSDLGFRLAFSPVRMAEARQADDILPCFVETAPVVILDRKRSLASMLPSTQGEMFRIGFNVFVETITEYVTDKLAQEKLCLDSAESQALSWLKFEPIYIDGTTPGSPYQTPSPVEPQPTDGCRISSPWIDLAIERRPVPWVHGLIRWNERQFLIDQAVLAGERDVSPELAPLLKRSEFEDYALEYATSKILNQPRTKPIEECVPPDLLWLFRRTGIEDLRHVSARSAINLFPSDAAATARQAMEMKAESYTKIVLALIDHCLESEGADIHYGNILDIADLIPLEQYKIDITPVIDKPVTRFR